MLQVIADRFEIERLVGSGGMGEVFRAKDRVTGGPVAVKVLYGSMARDVERFRREATLLAEVSHPRIVRYVAHGVAQGNRPYLAMEWLEGEDLGERLERSGLTLHETLSVATRTAEALAVLHERGIVHRDIKPSNLYLPSKNVDQVKVLDLGVARLLHQSRPSTRSGVMVGTPGYMAPEQARGVKEIDARADVFSLGCVIYECLTGEPAFAGENVAALLAKILLQAPPTLREAGVDVPLALDDLVTRMLSKHPTARPANGAAVLRELEQFKSIADAPARRASVPQIRALTGGERKLVCVVMAAYGEPPEDLAPASSYETIPASFDPRTVVASFGADAEVLADGSIVVTLSGKGGAGDQAAHAARCALALRSHLLTAHVALATGLSTVSGRGSAVGEVIERAAAILASARARQQEIGEETLGGQSPVFLDETTAGLLDMRFDVGGDDRGLFIRGLRDREAKPRTLLGKPTPFVGRERELSTLLGLFEECVHEPVARAVLVTGQPGGGKSRLAAEFLRRVKEDHDAEIWLARGDAMTEGSPFGLIARLIRRGCGITGGEPLVVRQQKLKARVSRHVPEPDVQRVAEFLGEIASVHFPDAQSVQLHAARQDTTLMGDQMRRAFCDITLAESASAPLVLVLEDLHWGDLPSVSFVDSALRTAAEKPFMVLAVARGEVHDAFPHLWEQRSLQEIRLGPLMRRAGERLVREVLGDDLSPDEVSRLLDRAAGNVFYLEELIRAYAEGTGRIVSSRPSSYARGTTPPPAPSEIPRLSPGAPGSLDVGGDSWGLPGTVLAMVEARLERLDPMARRVLRAASVFGEVFWRGGVLALTGGEYKASEVDDWLAELSRAEIVQRRDVSRFPGEHEYSFRHAIVRDAAYHMLTPEDVALGHKLAAGWLERAGEDEVMLLGEHYERGGAPEKAAGFYAQAAAEALEGNDFSAAKQRAERAIAAGATGAELGRLHLLLAEAARWAVDHDSALRHARSAMRELPVGSDGWYAAAAEAVEAAMTLAHVVEAKTTAEAVRDAASAGAMTSARVIATSRIVVHLVVAGVYDIADALLAPIERDATELVAKEPGTRAFVLAAQVARANLRGDIEEASSLAQEAVACFDLVGDVRNAAIQRHRAGYALVQLGLFTMAESVLRDAIASAEKLGLVGVANDARLHLGLVFVRTKRRDEAIATTRDAVAGYAMQRDRGGEGRARAYLAAAYQILKEHAAAEEEIVQALPLLDQLPAYRAGLLGLMALALADKGDADAAFMAGSEAMRILERLGATVEGESVVRIGYAEGLYAKGDIEGAKEAVAAARDRLLERANRIKNPSFRKNFLGTIQEHLRTLARAGEWLV